MKFSTFGFFTKTGFCFSLLIGASFAQTVQPSISDLFVASTIAETRSGLNWAVGDTSNYNLLMVSFGLTGTMSKQVKSDEGTALWISSETNMMGQKQVAEVLMSKADGKILKMIVNGQEQTPPNPGQMEITTQEASSIVVPAGSFDCIHIVAKTSEYPKIEAWINPRDTVMDGTLKQVVTSQFGDTAMELVSFTRH